MQLPFAIVIVVLLCDRLVCGVDMVRNKFRCIDDN